MTQRKLTASAKPDEELPKLTEAQERFVDGLLKGKTATQAYQDAYTSSRDWKKNSLWSEACKLHSNPKVAQWLRAARKAKLGSAVVTLESHITELDRLKEIAVESGNVGAAVQAENYRGRASGLYVDQRIITIQDPADTLRAIADVCPEIAQQIAEQMRLVSPQPKTINAEPT